MLAEIGADDGRLVVASQDDDLLTIAEAAELLKVSAVTVSRWRRQGRLPTLKVGPRAVRIRRGDLDRVALPYSGPVAGLSDAAPPAPPAPAAATATVPADRPETVARTMARATLLRTGILSRRKGEYLDPAGDDLGRLRDKRARRRH